MTRQEYDRHLVSIVSALLASGHYTLPGDDGDPPSVIHARINGSKIYTPVCLDRAVSLMYEIEASGDEWERLGVESGDDVKHLRPPYYDDLVAYQEWVEKHAATKSNPSVG